MAALEQSSSHARPLSDIDQPTCSFVILGIGEIGMTMGEVCSPPIEPLLAVVRGAGAAEDGIMTSDQLPHDALVSIAKVIDGQGNYLARLVVRMLDRGFPRNDPLWVEVIRASEAVKMLQRVVEELEQRKRPRPYAVHYPPSGTNEQT